MATITKLAEVLAGLTQNVDLTASDLVTNSVWVGGTTSSPSVQVTPSLLGSYLVNPMTTAGDLLYENATPAPDRLPIGTTGQILTVAGGLPTWADPASGGTVTSVSVVSANGLAGTVATSTTTPAITLSTTVTGILQGNGTAISAASTTGTGAVVLAASPTITGTLTAATVSASGPVTGSNLSGTNTGDQTITLTGDVTGSGTGSFATTVADIQGTAVSGTTGSGNVVFSASPTMTGTLAAAAITASSTVAATGAISGSNLTALGHASADLALAGGTMSGAINMGSNKVTNLTPGTAGTDAINLNQLQNYAQGVQWRPEVNLYDNVDTTLPATTATLIDGTTVTDGMRVLFTNLASNNNQVYTAAVVSTAITWTAALDNDRVSAAPVTGDSILVLSGTTWAESAFNYNGTSWVQFNGANQVQPGTALSKSGNTLNVLVDGSTIDAGGAGGSLEVKAGGIGSTQIASAAVTAAKLGSVTDGVTLDQSGSGSTIEIKTGGVGTAQLAATSVTAAKIATSAVDGTTITGGAGTALSAIATPAMQKTFLAGAALTANTSYLVRMAVSGETAGSVYLADASSAAANGKFWAIGLASGGASGISIGGSVLVTMLGTWTLGSADTAFSSGVVGTPVWLSTSGTFTTTAPSTSGYACYKVGIVQTTSSILVDSKQLTGVA